MKVASLALCLACAAPAFADVAVPQPAPKKSWASSCAERIDAAAKANGLKPGARASIIPLRHENGTPNPVQYVEYATNDISVTAGEEPEARPDKPWEPWLLSKPRRGIEQFRRLHNRFGKIETYGVQYASFIQALDECLKMGESK